MNADRLWVLGSLVLTAVILVAGWFLGVSPNLAQLAANEASREAAVALNAQQETELSSLAQRFAELPAMNAKLEAEKAIVPGTASLPAFLDTVNTLESTGARVSDVTFSEAIYYEPGVVVEPIAPVEEPAPTAEGEESADADSAAAVDGAAPAAPTEVPATIEGASSLGSANFWLIPVTIQVNGDFDQIMAYLDQLQASERLFVPFKLTVNFDEDKELFSNEFEGYLYVLGDESAGQQLVETVEGDTATVTVG